MALQKPAPKGTKKADEQPKPKAKGPTKTPEQLSAEARLAKLRVEAEKPDAKLLPEEWLEVVYPVELITPRGDVRRKGGHEAAKHAAAAALHGWDVEAYHQQDKTKRARLSRADYEAALLAPDNLQPQTRKRTRPDGTEVKRVIHEPVPHKAALSEWPAKLRQIAGIATKDGE